MKTLQKYLIPLLTNVWFAIIVAGLVIPAVYQFAPEYGQGVVYAMAIWLVCGLVIRWAATHADQVRAWPWLVSGAVFTAVVTFIAPHQLGVLAWSLSKLGLGAYLGYWIDRTVFYYARPGTLFENANLLAHDGQIEGAQKMRHQASLAALRRVGIMAATILALGLGV